MKPTREAVTEVTVELRYRDLDTLGHVNQSVYHVLLEDARIAFLRSLFGNHPRMVVARVEMDYRHEVRIADRVVTVTTAVERVGGSSMTLTSRMTTPSGTVAAEAVTVLVTWDPEQRTSRPLSDDERAALSGVLVEG
ncbi:MAG: acyl-CoA thioesterase [Patulibacter sp.]|nr:acyl-CoA thioesterase [Patulibacter sp.]